MSIIQLPHPTHTASSPPPTTASTLKKKTWSFKGAGEKDIAPLKACVKHKVWTLKHIEKREGWIKVSEIIDCTDHGT